MFSLIAKLGLDTTGFSTGANKAGSIASGLKSRLAQAFGTGAVIAYAKSVIDAADKIGDMADMAGMSAEEVQALTSHLSKAGIETETFLQAMFKLSEAARGAAFGNSELSETFKALGIDVAKFNKLDPAQQVTALGKALAEGKFDRSSEVAIMSNLMGMRIGPKGAAALKGIGESGMANLDPVSFSNKGVKEMSSFADDMASGWRSLKALTPTLARVGQGIASFGMSEIFRGLTPKKAEVPSVPGTNVFTPTNKASVAEVNAVLAVQSQIAEKIFKLKLDAMTPDKQRLELEKQIVEETKRGLKLFESGKRLEATESKLKVLELEGQLSRIKDAPIDSVARAGTGFTPDVNALQRIGAQSSAASPAVIVARAQLAVQQEIKTASWATARAVEKGGWEVGVP